MLKQLKLRGVGPAPSMEMALAPRLNVITGDNGLGKSFLLDVAWWALTRTWTGLTARPTRGAPDPSIEYTVVSGGKDVSYASAYDRKAEAWIGKAGRPLGGALVVYAQVDGSFSVWDPARNYWRTVGDVDQQDRPAAYVFSAQEIWDGLKRDGTTQCNGLIADWANWQAQSPRPSFALGGVLGMMAPQPVPVDTSNPGAQAFSLLRAALAAMAPSAEEPLVPGPLTRISLDDVRDIPTLRSLHGPDVPIVHASAGVRRIVALCYLLVWAWTEHQRASDLLEQETTRQIVFLVDEIDTHLHPRWQRRVLPALLQVVGMLTRSDQTSVQMIATTHAPLVLASIESLFDEARDQLWLLEARDQQVVLVVEPWAKQGDVRNWLVSEAFGLQQARSLEAERAIEAAEAFMRGAVEALPTDLQTSDRIHAELVRLLPDQDPFWPRWLVTTARVGGTTREA